MGDRANIALHFDSHELPLYLYTHWSGYEWPEQLRSALEFGRDRWNDEPYLARIITSRVFADDINSVTGGGLSPYLCDGDDRIVHVYLSENEVSYNEDEDRISFTEFLTYVPATWPRD